MIEIYRWYNKDCTLGRLSVNGFRCFTLELPWLNNKRNISCIPEAIYRYDFYKSPAHGDVMLLKDVPDRTFIEVHAGNYTSQIRGCILVGDSIRYLNNDSTPDVTNSRNTLKALLEKLPDTGNIRIYS